MQASAERKTNVIYIISALGFRPPALGYRLGITWDLWQTSKTLFTKKDKYKRLKTMIDDRDKARKEKEWQPLSA